MLFIIYSQNCWFLFSTHVVWQILQQCLLCQSWRDKYNRDEPPRSGLLIRIGVPIERVTKHLPHLLYSSPNRNVTGLSSSAIITITPKQIKENSNRPPFFHQWRGVQSSSSTTPISCLTSWWTLLIHWTYSSGPQWA